MNVVGVLWAFTTFFQRKVDDSWDVWGGCLDVVRSYFTSSKKRSRPIRITHAWSPITHCLPMSGSPWPLERERARAHEREREREVKVERGRE